MPGSLPVPQMSAGCLDRSRSSPGRIVLAGYRSNALTTERQQRFAPKSAGGIGCAQPITPHLVPYGIAFGRPRRRSTVMTAAVANADHAVELPAIKRSPWACPTHRSTTSVACSTHPVITRIEKPTPHATGKGQARRANTFERTAESIAVAPRCPSAAVPRNPST